MKLEFRLQSASLPAGCNTATKRVFNFSNPLSGQLLVSLDQQHEIGQSIYNRVLIEVSLDGQQCQPATAVLKLTPYARSDEARSTYNDT